MPTHKQNEASNMFKLDSLHLILLIALVGVSVNLGIQLDKNSSPRWKPNPNAMQEACQKNPEMLVCNLKDGSKWEAK